MRVIMRGLACSGLNIRRLIARWLSGNRDVTTEMGLSVEQLALICASDWPNVPVPFTFDEVVVRIFKGETSPALQEELLTHPIHPPHPPHPTPPHSTPPHSTSSK